MAGRPTATWRSQIVARLVELRPQVLALMRESVPQERHGYGQATGRQLEALASLSPAGITMSQLAADLKVTGAAASVLAERLVALGLAVRHTAPGDRRVVRLAPTREGAKVARRYTDNQRHALAALLDRLTDTQAAAWLDIMETLAASGHPGPGDARTAALAGAAR